MATREELGYEEAVELLQRAVAERGEDYVYRAPVKNGVEDACEYFSNGEPQCIIGLILSYKELTIENDGDNNTLKISEIIGRGLFPLLVDDKTNALLCEVQHYQDEKMPWGIAVERGLDYVNKAYAA